MTGDRAHLPFATPLASARALSDVAVEGRRLPVRHGAICCRTV